MYPTDPENTNDMDALKDFINENGKDGFIAANGMNGSFMGADDFFGMSGGEFMDNGKINNLKYSVDYDFDDINFSSADGDFSEALGQIHHKLKNTKKKKKIQKLSQKIPVTKSTTIIGKGGVKKVIADVKVPDDRQLIIEGVERFILNKDEKCEAIKTIGYYNCEKLKQLMLHIDNTASAIDFTMELFNTSEPLDYLYSTGLNLNNKIIVGGGVGMSYSDVLTNMACNPTMIPNATINYTGSNVYGQINQPMRFTNRNIEGAYVSNPMQLQLNVDPFQFQNNIVYFNIARDLHRPFIPNGADVISYTVLAGNSVDICFFYKQHSVAKFFFKEARDSNNLL